MIVVQPLHYAKSDSTILETSWVDNKLIFENESFDDIAIKMERWFGMPVNFDYPPLRTERLTGSFTNESIEDALQALQMTTRFNYLKRENSIIITK